MSLLQKPKASNFNFHLMVASRNHLRHFSSASQHPDTLTRLRSAACQDEIWPCTFYFNLCYSDRIVLQQTSHLLSDVTEPETHVDAFSERVTARVSLGVRWARDDRRLEVAVPFLQSLFCTTAPPVLPPHPLFVCRIPSMPLTLTGHCIVREPFQLPGLQPGG